jgi:hypothetical protein
MPVFQETPPERLDSLDPIHPETFCRSNPEFYQFYEHCSPCLGNLPCYSLKTTVNRVKVLTILFSSYLFRFSSDLIRSSCVRSIIM